MHKVYVCKLPVVNKHFHVICYPVSLSGKVVVISSSRIGIKALFLFMSCISGRHANKYIFFSGHTTFFLLLSFFVDFFWHNSGSGVLPPPPYFVCVFPYLNTEALLFLVHNFYNSPFSRNKTQSWSAISLLCHCSLASSNALSDSFLTFSTTISSTW